MTSARSGVCATTCSRGAHRALCFVALLVSLVVASPSLSETKVETDEQKVIYFIGLLTARQLDMLNLSDSEFEIIERALQDSRTGKEIEIDPEEFGPKLRIFQQDRAKITLGLEKQRSEAFVKEQAKLSGAQVTDSGLIYFEVEAGDGEQATPESTVNVKYEGRLRDGTVFDGRVAEFPLEGVIKCWGEGVGRMKIGGKAKLVCPSEIAYGERGMPPVIPPGAALIFDVELLEIKSADE